MYRKSYTAKDINYIQCISLLYIYYLLYLNFLVAMVNAQRNKLYVHPAFHLNLDDNIFISSIKLITIFIGFIYDNKIDYVTFSLILKAYPSSPLYSWIIKYANVVIVCVTVSKTQSQHKQDINATEVSKAMSNRNCSYQTNN